MHSIDQVHDGFGKNEHDHSISTNSNHNIEHNGNNNNVTKVLMGSSNQMSSCDYISSPSTTVRTQVVTDENHGSSFVVINDKSNNNKRISEELETGSNHTSHTSFSQSIRSDGRGIGLTARDNVAGNIGTGNNEDSDSIISVLGGSDSQPDRTLCGGPNNDVLFGSPGNDIIYGGAGSDKLFGGPGNDILIRGQNADYFNCGPGTDTIRDFHATEEDTKTHDCENY
jgi:Ca2+-binding RTX toxin-like protein